MKKRLLSIVLTFAVIVSMFTVFAPVAQASTTFGPYVTGNIEWGVVIPAGERDGTLTVRSRAGITNAAIPGYSSASRPPWFGHSANVNKIILEAGITEVGNWAFADFTKVTDVIVLGNLSRIGNDAFRECVMLELFRGSDFGPSKVFPTWPATTALSIGDSAFYNCGKLIELRIPGVNAIGANAFAGCRLNTIDAGTDGRIRNLGINDIVVEMDTATPAQPVRVIKAPVGLLANTAGAYRLPPTITRIDTEAFAHTGISEYVISESVTSIGDRAFAYNSALVKAVFLGHAPTTFGAGVFSGAGGGFFIEFYPYAQRWTTPTWQGYPTMVNNSRITLDKYFITLEVGASTEIRATINPASAGQVVEWSVEPNTGTPSDPTNGDFATVGFSSDSRIGLITGKAPGMATVRAKADSGAEVECIVVVVERGVTSIALDRSQLTVQLGNSATRTSLTAIVNPSPTLPGGGLVWSSSNTSVARVESETPASLTNWIEFGNPGTATITVRSPDGRTSASFVLTLLAPPTFIPVTGVTLSTTTAARGVKIDLNSIATVHPTNATNRGELTWSIISQTTGQTASIDPLDEKTLTIPATYIGNIVVEATVKRGIADMDPQWGFSGDVDYTQRFTINVVPFLPVASITDIPLMAYVGIPLQLKGTVNPAGASYKTIKWSIVNDNTDSGTPVIFDSVNGILTAQWPGSVVVKATIENGLMGAASGLGAQTLAPFELEFTVWVYPYTTNELNLRANPGGRVSNAGTSQLAGGETITVTAIPDAGYIFSGWAATNGGTFANANSSTTQFTMPGAATTVTAQFTFTGTGGGGGTVLPAPTHYFKNGSIYTKGSITEFTHVTVRDFSLFSHVTLNGLLLTRNGHYTAARSAGHTEISLANGYLDTLERGTYTLVVLFSDQVSVTARFTVTGTISTPQMFNDVPVSAWYYTGVTFAGSRGWMTPDANRNFRPDANVTQGEVVDALYRMAGLPSVLNQRGQPLYGRAAAHEWMLQSAILPIGGQFNLSSAITRQDVVLLLYRLTHFSRLEYRFVRSAYTFSDEWQISGAARNAVNDAYRAGLINGRSLTTFVPLGNMTRAEFATTLHRYSDMVSIYA